MKEELSIEMEKVVYVRFVIAVNISLQCRYVISIKNVTFQMSLLHPIYWWIFINCYTGKIG